MSKEQESSLKKYEAYKKWTEIDKFDLDEEVSHQTSLHQQIGEEWAQAANMRDLAEINIDIVKADLNIRFREEAITERERVTDDKIKALVTSAKPVVEAQQEYLSWKYISNLWYSLNKSFEERSSMIERLCQLNTSGYYEKSSIKGEARNRLAESVKGDQNRHRQLRELAAKVGQGKQNEK